MTALKKSQYPPKKINKDHGCTLAETTSAKAAKAAKAVETARNNRRRQFPKGASRP
jgi:hypothetical protein